VFWVAFALCSTQTVFSRLKNVILTIFANMFALFFKRGLGVLRNRGWVLHNPTKPAHEVRIAPTYEHMFKPYFVGCGTF